MNGLDKKRPTVFHLCRSGFKVLSREQHILVNAQPYLHTTESCTSTSLRYVSANLNDLPINHAPSIPYHHGNLTADDRRCYNHTQLTGNQVCSIWNGITPRRRILSVADPVFRSTRVFIKMEKGKPLQNMYTPESGTAEST